jgi:hypothetical protein
MVKKFRHLHPFRRIAALSVKSKILYSLTFFILLAFITTTGLYLRAQDLDSKNENLLRSITADFGRLEESLEAELDVSVENKSGCFTTSEKFGSGKTACFIRLDIFEEVIDHKDLLVAIMEDSLTDESIEEFKSKGYSFNYRNRSCLAIFDSFGYASAFYVECPVPVRAKNKDLLKQLFEQ